MGCSCPCGNEYGFDPIGFWICHKCGEMHDAGPLGRSRKTDVIDPDHVDEMVRQGVEFAGHADSALRAHIGSVDAWYALGATYAARGNFIESGLIWTKAAAMVESDDELAAFVSRAAECLAGCVVATSMVGSKSNVPYAYGLEYMCIHRLGNRVSFCRMAYDRICADISKVPPRGALMVRNMASLFMLERIELLPDMREHIPILKLIVSDSDSFSSSYHSTLNPIKRMVSKKTGEFTEYLSEPYRMALARAEGAVQGMDVSEADRLASLQPNDGSAGFTDHLTKAVSKGSEVAYMKATKAQESEISAMEREIDDDIDAYISLYLAGNPANISGASVYRG